MPHLAALLVVALFPQDPRDSYDVEVYRISLVLDTEARELRGTVRMQARVVAEALDAIELDLTSRASVEAVALSWSELSAERRNEERAIPFAHEGERLICRVEPRPARKDETLSLAITYRVPPGGYDKPFGLRWSTTEDGGPWVCTFSQPVGAHSWWPCKSGYFHPEDKAERVAIDVTVPEGLVAVSNGRQVGPGGVQAIRPASAPREEPEWRTFRWSHDYPVSTHAVALAIGPFVEVSNVIELPAGGGRVPFQYWVLPESLEAAAVQFAEVPRLIDVFTQHFGPFPFPRSKVGFAQVDFLGMGHASLVSYGSTFPAWCEKTGKEDPRGPHHRDYDRTLVHELAHEWWGNSVSARDWGEMWLHEGFATYAEGVWVEATLGREEADRFFERLARGLRKDARLIRGEGLNAREGYAQCLYDKGAVVLHTLRHYLDDDEAWWQSLRAFQERFRYGCVTTADFRATVEETSGRRLASFFEEWVSGSGTPSLDGTIRVEGGTVAIDVDCRSDTGQGFHVPLDVGWTDARGPRLARLDLRPGRNEFALPIEGEISGLRVLHLSRLPGRHKLKIE